MSRLLGSIAVLALLSASNAVADETPRARLQSPPIQSTQHYGGQVITLPGQDVAPIALDDAESRKARAEYEEFLSRGKFSRLRSIGIGYSGGGGGYSISRAGGGTAIRTSSGSSGRSGSAGFATINNGGTNLGRSSGSSFATINNNSGALGRR